MSDLGAIFSKPKIDLPDPKANVALPDPEAPTVREAGRRRRREEAERAGRASTDHSGVQPPYVNTQLGG